MSVFNTSRLIGQTVLITGASSGIGAVRVADWNVCSSLISFRLLLSSSQKYEFEFKYSVVELVFIGFMQGGSNVILLARRVDALAKVAADCAAAHKEAGHQLGGKFATVQLDVSDRQQVADLWSRVPEDLRDVDILGLFFLFE